MDDQQVFDLITAIDRLASAIEKDSSVKEKTSEKETTTKEKEASSKAAKYAKKVAKNIAKRSATIAAAGPLEIIKSITEEVTTSATDPIKYGKLQPLQETMKYGEELGKAGVPIDREYIKQVHDHYKGINLNVLEWRKEIRTQGGFLPRGLQAGLGAATSFAIEKIQKVKDAFDKVKTATNEKLNGE